MHNLDIINSTQNLMMLKIYIFFEKFGSDQKE